MEHANFFTIAEKYQKEKELYALSSTYRPDVEQTLEVNVRQTLFPTILHHDESSTKK